MNISKQELRKRIQQALEKGGVKLTVLEEKSHKLDPQAFFKQADYHNKIFDSLEYTGLGK